MLRAQATYEDGVDLLGEVRAADKDAEGFVLRTADGRKLEVHAPPSSFPSRSARSENRRSFASEGPARTTPRESS